MFLNQFELVLLLLFFELFELLLTLCDLFLKVLFLFIIFLLIQLGLGSVDGFLDRVNSWLAWCLWFLLLGLLLWLLFTLFRSRLIHTLLIRALLVFSSLIRSRLTLGIFLLSGSLWSLLALLICGLLLFALGRV